MNLRSAALVLALVLVPLSARGGDDPRKAQASALFQRGLTLHDQDREPEALDHFRRAYDLYPTPAGLVALARSEQLVGKRLEALRHYRQALKEPTISPKSAELAAKYVAELEPSFARVELRGPKGLVVTIRGDEHILPMAEPLDMAPGDIEATATYGHEKYGGRANAPAGALTVLDLSAADPASTSSSVNMTPARTEGQAPSARPSFWDTGRIAGAALAGVGVASLVASTLFRASSFAHADQRDAIQRQLGSSSCAPSASPVSAECSGLGRERDAVDRDAVVSTITFAGGIAFVATGVALFVWPRSPHVRVAPSAGTSTAGLSLSGVF